jgi:hypothetical protein
MLGSRLRESLWQPEVIVNGFQHGLALVALVLVGCTATPELESGGTLPAAAELASSAADSAATESVAVAPALVVDAHEMATRTGPPIICREVLKQGSNVITTECRTAEGWKLYERRQAQEAAEIVRMLQGSRYR